MRNTLFGKVYERKGHHRKKFLLKSARKREFIRRLSIFNYQFYSIHCFSTWTSATSESENSMSDSEEENRRPPPKRKPVKRKNQKSQYSSESDSDDENKRLGIVW